LARVLILGASSAIAAEVAVIHAARGDRLHLVGRTKAKLEQVVARCRAVAKEPVTFIVADLADLEAMAGLVASCIEALGGIDTALIAHGDLFDQLASEAGFAAAEASLRLNFLSPVALVVPLANHFEAQRGGRLGVITSVAGDRGRPRNYTYGAAKGGLGLYLQGVRSRLYGTGVTVTTLKLGPVDTPMTTTHAKNAVFSQPKPVAEGIVRAMDAKRREVYVPGYWAAIMFVVRHTPEALFQKLAFLSGR
jgi:decaprenylphospho-beta-D-erythro-pentofuranosid-2-ulose 2-reductase